MPSDRITNPIQGLAVGDRLFQRQSAPTDQLSLVLLPPHRIIDVLSRESLGECVRVMLARMPHHCFESGFRGTGQSHAPSPTRGRFALKIP